MSTGLVSAGAHRLLVLKEALEAGLDVVWHEGIGGGMYRVLLPDGVGLLCGEEMVSGMIWGMYLSRGEMPPERAPNAMERAYAQAREKW